MNNNKQTYEEINNSFQQEATELLEHLNENVKDYEQIHDELNELQIQREKAMNVFYALSGIASVYTLMFVMKIVMAILA